MRTINLVTIADWFTGYRVLVPPKKIYIFFLLSMQKIVSLKMI